MSKRPSLAETMRQVVQTQPEPPAAAPKQPRRARTENPTVGRFHAATREGKKKVTGNLPPSTHKQLKTLAVQHDTAIEDLVLEAIGDLLAKYNVKDKAA
jgi:antitoxin-like ribbon-helix-helix protein